jgi:MFS family permease
MVTSPPPDIEAPRIPPRAAFQHRDFRLYQVARLVSVLVMEMQSIAVAWQVYQITHRAIDLGYVGLAQFLPGLLLSLPAGHVADRYDRRRILLICNTVQGILSAFLLFHALQPHQSQYAIFAIMAASGVARAFSGPASQSLTPHLVPEEHFPNAVAWSSSIFMLATIIGPGLGGLFYGLGGTADRGAEFIYAVAIAGFVVTVISIFLLHTRTGRLEHKAASLKTLFAGFHYVWQKKEILGSISLDLFAVFLGGAVALLPIFADQVLHTGAWGLGLMRTAPAIGAAITGGLVAYFPVRKRIGAVLFVCVTIFGLATIGFALSRTLWMSMLALFIMGASDMVSVIIRGTLVQITTPPEMRGRVSAVNLLFIGASNELGEFESGLTGQWFGAVNAVLIGGIGTLVVVGLWFWLFPQLRHVDEFGRG